MCVDNKGVMSSNACSAEGSGELLCSLFLLFKNCLIKILLPNLFHLSKKWISYSFLKMGTAFFESPGTKLSENCNKLETSNMNI